jgi:hypothetical protein
MILEEGAYRPADPNFEDHAIENTHIFFFGLKLKLNNSIVLSIYSMVIGDQ